MARFEEYRDKYKHLRMERNEGILEVMLHSDGGPVVWGAGPHSECGAAILCPIWAAGGDGIPCGQWGAVVDW